MQTLESLVRQAQVLGGAMAGDSALAPRPPAAGLALSHEAELARQLQICNACRYCEGFCAVFPAMTRRLEFGAADVHYLANLCHNCGACLHACQYAAPHDFAVNVPRAMARVRMDTYRAYAWPPALGALYQRNGLTLALALVASLCLFLVLVLWRNGTLWSAGGTGDFYRVFPHNLLVLMFAPVLAFAVLALGQGVRRFWSEAPPGAVTTAAGAEAARNVLSLKYLDGGHGLGCNDEDDRFTLRRRRWHHFSFYGFALCFASTGVATLYHYLLDWRAPYALTSAPVVLGTAGGVSLLVGCLGLWRLNLRRDPVHGDPAQRPMDRAFIALLVLTSASGLALLGWRESVAMASLLAVHLGTVMALFLTLPYGKFAHGVFRSAALLKWAIERRQPDTLKLGTD